MASTLATTFRALRWLPAYLAQRLTRRRAGAGRVHVLIALADHFEPAIVPDAPQTFASLPEQHRRLDHWCSTYRGAVGRWRDSTGRPFRHTYFYPAEQYESGLLARLADHCHSGWGEVEVHLHHGVAAPDTAVNTRLTLLHFRDALAVHGLLSRWQDTGPPRYAFVHGNWALANSAAGRYCGVDEEMQILAETGCYADLTLPSAPSPAQVATINTLYECALPLSRRAPHRRGRRLRVGRAPRTLPVIIQGPLAAYRKRFLRPGIENGEIALRMPPTLDRLARWCRTPITVLGRPDWVFVKLHCHGMDPRDQTTLLGAPIQRFLADLAALAASTALVTHFVSAREMVNVALAACDGLTGDPTGFRDYRLRLIHPIPNPS